LLNRHSSYWPDDCCLTIVANYLATLGSIVSQRHVFFLLLVVDWQDPSDYRHVIAAVDCLNRTAIVADGSTPGIFDFSIASSDSEAEEMLTAHLYGSFAACPTKIHHVIYMDSSRSRLPSAVLLMWSVCCSPWPVLLLCVGLAVLLLCLVVARWCIGWFAAMLLLVYWLVHRHVTGSAVLLLLFVTMLLLVNWLVHRRVTDSTVLLLLVIDLELWWIWIYAYGL
jgi:hypothetical protein